MMRDFSPSDHPPRSATLLVDIASLPRHQQPPPCWRDMFKDVIEATARATTHRSHATNSEMTIDPVFILGGA
eukprot:9474248-Pyramimonas_sp.AAC.2